MNLFQEILSLWYVDPLKLFAVNTKEIEVNSLIFGDCVKKVLEYKYV